MMTIAIHAAIIYLLLGIVANLLAADLRIRIAAKLIVLLGWPWMIWNEGTPNMEKFLTWAKKDKMW